MTRIIKAIALIAVFMCLSPALFAQWPAFKSRRTPRTAAGEPDLNAPTPRTADGKPDFSGTWQTGRAGGGQRGAGPGGGQRGAGGGAPAAGGPPSAQAPAPPPATPESGPPIATFGNAG